MGSMIAWIWFLYQILPRPVYPGWDTMNCIAVGNQASWCYHVFVLRSLHFVKRICDHSSKTQSRADEWKGKIEVMVRLEVDGNIGWLGQLRQLALESLETRKKVVSQVPDLTAVTFKRCLCTHGTQEVVWKGGRDLQCVLLRDVSKILIVVFCITVFYL
jgi:hypothetical protein